MENFTADQFKKTGNNLMLGPEYGNYTTQQLQHLPSGKHIDILVDAGGQPVTEANEVTDRIRAAFVLDGRNAKIIPIQIDRAALLILKMSAIS